jgi:hypothetical protein
MTLDANALNAIGMIRTLWQDRTVEGLAEVNTRLDEQSFDPLTLQMPAPRLLPTVAYLDTCLDETALIYPELAAAIRSLAPHFRWLQSKAYTDDLLGEGFANNYGWTEIIGPNGFFKGQDFLLGLLILGPHRHYLDHHHPAPELYWPLTSATEWRKGEGAFESKAAGTPIWHPPWIAHATKTGERPLLALWCWTRETTVPASLI